MVDADLATTYANRDVLGEQRIQIRSASTTILTGKDVVVVRLGQDTNPTNVGPPPGYPSLTACSLVFYNAKTGTWLSTFGEGVALPTPSTAI